MPLNLVARRDGSQMLAPLETSRMLLTAGSARRPEQPAPVLHRAGSSGSKKLSSSVCTHQDMRRLRTADASAHNRDADLRPSTSVPMLFRGTGGNFTKAPPRDLLASRGAQVLSPFLCEMCVRARVCMGEPWKRM